MDNPGYVGLARQSGLLREMQVVANNIANMATTGFRREGIVFAEHVAATGPDDPSLSIGSAVGRSISPVQGADIKGPTAVVKSASKIDHLRTGGTLLNQKFTPQLLDDETGINAAVKLVRGYFQLNGHHIQFNVVTADTLRDAQKHPEKYRDLIVRVAGYSDYFNDLGEALQNEIIRRTEHMDSEQ